MTSANEIPPELVHEANSDTEPLPVAIDVKEVRSMSLMPLTIGICILAIIAFVAALYLARAFFVPLFIGIFATYALHPIVDWLKACHIPRAIAAALVVIGLVGGMGWVAVSLTDDAEAMLEKLPETAAKLRKNLTTQKAKSPTALQNVQKAATELERAATDVAGIRKPVVITRDVLPVAWLRDYLLAQLALIVAVIAQAPIVLLLTYFLLAAGDHFRRKLMEFVGPTHSYKKEAIRILEEIDIQMQRYLLATVISNILVAICTWLVFIALDMDQAGAWGVTAGLLHFIPYLGPAIFAVASGVGAFLQFGTPLYAIAVAGMSLLVATAVGLIFMTWLQGRFARVNTAVLFIALLFFGWLWGAWGLLLGAPLVAIIKTVCDRVEALKPLGGLLGR
jgi:predicted PurR-regulated permease PerM